MTRRTPEDDLQKTCLQYLLLAVPQSEAIWFHVPNGGLRSKRTAAHLKSMGVLPGVADLVFILPGGKVGFVEMKAPKGRLEPEQRDFAARADALGASYYIAKSLDEFIGAVEAIGIRPRVRAAA